jgi:hypothetical protein
LFASFPSWFFEWTRDGEEGVWIYETKDSLLKDYSFSKGMQGEYQLANPRMKGIRGFSSGFTGFQGEAAGLRREDNSLKGESE